GAQHVLILDGEQLVGSRQNRMTNRSILLPSKSRTEIPVYCMEQGRWHFDSDTMAPTQQHSPTKVRRRARETEHRHAAAGLAASPAMLREAQSDVWADISETASKVGGHSTTGALDNVFATNIGRIDTWLSAFPLGDDQVGLLAFLGGGPLALDLIASHRLYRRVHGRLLRGYVLDAIERLGAAGDDTTVTRERAPAATSSSEAQGFLDVVRNAARVDAPTVGGGRYNVLTDSVIGGELLHGDRLVHLSAFPAAAFRSRGTYTAAQDNPVAPPSRRRHHRGGGSA
ncbi:MAG: ARPP-1 family domain-containing protein, partial [Longimicrobiales bacterium]